MITIDGLYKKYRRADFFAIEGLSLTIDEGEVFGMLGPNGAGKTTLISMLCALIKPTSGRFSIDGLSYSENKQQLKQAIGIVPQEYALYPALTAYENLLYFGSMYGLRGKDLTKKIDEQLSILGLRSFAHKKINAYSGGMKRRVNLIAGLLHDPRVLFLDEPTTGVDVRSKNAIIGHLKTLHQNGTTIVYTSHHLNEAEAFCDRVAIIDRGRLKLLGRPQELVAGTEGAGNLEEVFLKSTKLEIRN